MSRLLRWRFWLPRLLIVCLAIGLLQCALNFMARDLAIRTARSTFGVDLRVGSAYVSLLRPRVVLRDLSLAASGDDGPTLRAERWELKFSPSDLLHKRLVISDARLSHLHIEPGTAADASALQRDWFPAEAARPADAWLSQLNDQLADSSIEALESIRRCEAITQQWEQRFARHAKRAAEVAARAESLKKSADASMANRIRHRAELAALPAEIASLQEEAAGLTAEAAEWTRALDADRRALASLRRNDEQALRTDLKPVDADALTAYLLREPVTGALDGLVRLLQSLRRLPATSAPRPDRRGVDVLFAGCKPRPDVLIEHLALETNTHIAGYPARLTGLVAQLSDSPRLHDRPISLRIQGTGSMPIELVATLDRTGPVPRDEVFIDCRGISVPELVLGNADQLAIVAAPAPGTFSVSALLEGERLTCELQLTQDNVHLAPRVGNGFADSGLEASLESTLGRVRSLAVRATLGGTLDEPTCTCWSTLGSTASEALRIAATRALEEHLRQQIASAARRVDERLTNLERKMVDQDRQLARQLSAFSDDLDRIVQRLEAPERLSAERLGRTLPENSLFR